MVKTRRKIIVAIILAFTLVGLVFSMTIYSATAKNSVNPQGLISSSIKIGVYSNQACTIKETSMSWGSIAAGAKATQTLYVKNTGTNPITLSLASSNWNPANGGTYIKLSWNQQGTRLSAGQSVAAAITLTVSSNITGISSFQNIIKIVGTSARHH